MLYARKFGICVEVLAHVFGLPDVYRLPAVQVGLLGDDVVGGKFPELRAHFVDIVDIYLTGVPPPVYLLRQTEVLHAVFT